jgi:hypothetical protein
MKFIAVASENNESFSVVAGQVLYALDIEENIYTDPETGDFVQEMLDGYLVKGRYSNQERSIAELCEFDWVEVEEFPEVFQPIVPTE